MNKPPRITYAITHSQEDECLQDDCEYHQIERDNYERQRNPLWWRLLKAFVSGWLMIIVVLAIKSCK